MRYILTLFLALILAGCSTNPPEPPTVDGSDRQPINSQQTIAKLALEAELAQNKSAPRPAATPFKVPSKTISVVFDGNNTDFKPTPAQEHDIAELIPTSEHIEVRGISATTPKTANGVGIAVARKRAIGAGLYLISNGAKSAQISTDYKTVSTASDAPYTRKVEIEFFSKQP